MSDTPLLTEPTDEVLERICDAHWNKEKAAGKLSLTPPGFCNPGRSGREKTLDRPPWATYSGTVKSKKHVEEILASIRP